MTQPLLNGFIALQASGSPQIMNIIFIFGLLIVFYFFMILPQQRKQKRQKNFLESLQKGDHVVTMGGLHGKISAIENNIIVLEVDRGTKMRFEKSFISQENTDLANKIDSSK